jgi:hypothetical protein
MSTTGAKSFSEVYAAWLGKPVVLLVIIRRYHVPVACCIVDESVGALRVRMEAGWELEIRKELILAVEEDFAAHVRRVN